MPTFLRFFLVVAFAYGVYVFTYWFLSRVIWPAGNREFQNVVAVCTGDTVNFFLNRQWTFQAKGSYLRHAGRFILVASFTLLIQAGLFWIGRVVFHVYDLLLAVSLPVVRASLNYLLHKSYTFRKDTNREAGML